MFFERTRRLSTRIVVECDIRYATLTPVISISSSAHRAWTLSRGLQAPS